jgi:hypothetical protein
MTHAEYQESIAEQSRHQGPFSTEIIRMAKIRVISSLVHFKTRTDTKISNLVI